MESNLKPCPFCGGEAKGYWGYLANEISCTRCHAIVRGDLKDETIEAWNRRASEIVKVETCFYDKEEIHENCTVQVLTNTKTGDVSVGWWENEV